MRHFIAHLLIESSHLTHLEENLHYSAHRLREVWPSRFKTDAAAQKCARNPKALADIVYGGRLGNCHPGDGWLYRGRGYLQHTGRANYAELSDLTGLDLIGNPDQLLEVSTAVKCACLFWKKRGLNEIVDADPDETATDNITMELANEEDDLERGTKRINGGLIGLSDRRKALAETIRIWPGE